MLERASAGERRSASAGVGGLRAAQRRRRRACACRSQAVSVGTGAHEPAVVPCGLRRLEVDMVGT
jgi:hypothetical protein